MRVWAVDESSFLGSLKAGQGQKSWLWIKHHPRSLLPKLNPLVLGRPSEWVTLSRKLEQVREGARVCGGGVGLVTCLSNSHTPANALADRLPLLVQLSVPCSWRPSQLFPLGGFQVVLLIMGEDWLVIPCKLIGQQLMPLPGYYQHYIPSAASCGELTEMNTFIRYSLTCGSKEATQS